jgi:hypothetical protein
MAPEERAIWKIAILVGGSGLFKSRIKNTMLIIIPIRRNDRIAGRDMSHKAIRFVRTEGWAIFGFVLARTSFSCSRTANDGPINVTIIITICIQYCVSIAIMYPHIGDADA